MTDRRTRAGPSRGDPTSAGASVPAVPPRAMASPPVKPGATQTIKAHSRCDTLDRHNMTRKRCEVRKDVFLKSWRVAICAGEIRLPRTRRQGAGAHQDLFL